MALYEPGCRRLTYPTLPCAAASGSSGELVDVELKGSIESMVIKWNTQVDEVLKRDSAAALLGGHSPGPMVGE